MLANRGGVFNGKDSGKVAIEVEVVAVEKKTIMADKILGGRLVFCQLWT
jgi:hypothetical protein